MRSPNTARSAAITRARSAVSARAWAVSRPLRHFRMPRPKTHTTVKHAPLTSASQLSKYGASTSASAPIKAYTITRPVTAGHRVRHAATAYSANATPVGTVPAFHRSAAIVATAAMMAARTVRGKRRRSASGRVPPSASRTSHAFGSG